MPRRRRTPPPPRSETQRPRYWVDHAPTSTTSPSTPRPTSRSSARATPGTRHRRPPAYTPSAPRALTRRCSRCRSPTMGTSSSATPAPGCGAASTADLLSVPGSTLVSMAFATEHPVLAHSEYRPVEDMVRAGGRFEVVSPYAPAGDQPAAIDELERRIQAGERDIVLLGATGTGKSATTAWLIERLQRPTLVMAPNKTLAAQLANELREMLPHNAVEYFVSYYDYYQPEAYIAQTDTYIEKDSSINDDVERLRHSATSSLLSRRDVVVVASVSCIYGLGTPQSYLDRSVELQVGDEVPRDGLLRLLADVQLTPKDLQMPTGTV